MIFPVILFRAALRFIQNIFRTFSQKRKIIFKIYLFQPFIFLFFLFLLNRSEFSLFSINLVFKAANFLSH